MAQSYKYLGPRGPVTGVADTTGNNTGNWTVTFQPNFLSFTVPEAFVYKIQVMGAGGSSFNVYVENKQWDSNIYGAQNSWDDNAGDSLIIRPGESLYFYFSDPVSDGTPPVVTIFLRYDLNKFGANYQ
jgi:hypothetical protein